MGPKVCDKLTDFVFHYKDVYYNARDRASEVTEDAIISLAESCPILKKVQLQDARKLTDEALLACFQHCPKLTSLEITAGSGGIPPQLSGSALEALERNPDLVPKLKKLILPHDDENVRFMKAMRAATKERLGLTVQLVLKSEYKKWGDWELSTLSETYKKGRKQPWKN